MWYGARGTGGRRRRFYLRVLLRDAHARVSETATIFFHRQYNCKNAHVCAACVQESFMCASIIAEQEHSPPVLKAALHGLYFLGLIFAFTAVVVVCIRTSPAAALAAALTHIHVLLGASPRTCPRHAFLPRPSDATHFPGKGYTVSVHYVGKVKSPKSTGTRPVFATLSSTAVPPRCRRLYLSRLDSRKSLFTFAQSSVFAAGCLARWTFFDSHIQKESDENT